MLFSTNNTETFYICIISAIIILLEQIYINYGVYSGGSSSTLKGRLGPTNY